MHYRYRLYSGAIMGLLVIAVLSGCAGKSAYRHEVQPIVKSEVRRIMPSAVCSGTSATYVVKNKRYWVRPAEVGQIEHGLASWYGEPFHGRRTASGEIFDMYRRTAAHRTLPMFSTVEVINLKNLRKIVVSINDRGPFIKDRHIDLSYFAAKELGMLNAGVVPVEIKVLALPKQESLG